LGQPDLEDLAEKARQKTFQKGQFICWQGDHWPYVLYFTSGKVAWVMHSPEGKRQIAFHILAGDVVWGLTLFDEQSMPATLEVVEDCQAYLWSRDEILPAVSKNVEAVWDVTRVLTSAMRRVREVVYGFAFHTVAGRVARLLLDYYQPAEGEPARRELTLDEMAAAVGTTRELVCKILYRFADEGMIRINRTEFVFTDPGKLEELAREG
jgi:CRP/FNR family cyclic AMP-dependent transcriptional regulator